MTPTTPTLLITASLLVATGPLDFRPVAAFDGGTVRADDSDLAAAHRLAAALRFPTVSLEPPATADPEPFRGLHAFLRTAYPRVHRALRREVVGEHSLLYTWDGADPAMPAVLLAAHLDVVPVEPGAEGRWTYPPFAGIVADGHVWGRGALDDKAAVLGILEAVERLLAAGARPARPVYLAFGHDEEVGGRAGARRIAELLRSRGIRLAFVHDEGGVVAQGLIPGVARPVAVIGIAEKGRLTLELSVAGTPGHASAPPPQTAVGILSEAIRRLEAAPMAPSLAGPTGELLAAVAPELPWASRVALAHLWLLEPWVARRLGGSPVTNALIRTTAAVTTVRGGTKANVLPADAAATVDIRIRPGNTIAEVRAHVGRAIGDPRVGIRALAATEPSPVSSSRDPGYRAVARAVARVAPDALVAPGLAVVRTDSEHYLPLAEAAYRFRPYRLGRQDLGRIHGTDERIGVAEHGALIRFYGELLRGLLAEEAAR